MAGSLRSPAAVEDKAVVVGCLSVGRPEVGRPVEGGKSAVIGSSEVEDLPASVLADVAASTAPEGRPECQHTQHHPRTGAVPEVAAE